MQAEADAKRFGGVVMVVQGDSVLFERAAGEALRSANLPITRDTRFPLASIGKLFTAVAIGQLLDQGKLALDDPLTHWLPEHTTRPEWSKVTIRQLLAHTSGFGSYWGAPFEARRTNLKAVADYFPLFETTPLAFEPGSRFEYSNVGYVLLGAIIERAGAQDYFDYVQQHVFDAADMRDSGYFEADEDIPNLAMVYTYRTLPEGAHNHLPPRTHTQLKPFKGGPAGDAISTAPDLVRFGQALLQGRLLQPNTFDLFRRPISIWPPPPGAKLIQRMALGFITIDSEHGTPIGHTGGSAGTTASLFLDPSTGVITVILASVDHEQAHPIVALLHQTWLNHAFTPAR